MLILAALAMPSACAGVGSGVGAVDASASVAATAATAAATRERVVLVPQEPAPLAGLGPEILLPEAGAGDEEVARVGDLVLRKSHAFTRLFTADPKLALDAVDLLVFDVLVARHAEQFGVRVDPAAVERLALAEEQAMQRQVEAELGRELDFGAYVFSMFGMRLEQWRRTLRLRTAQRLYHGFVIRYLALREDRVQVRYLVHRDRAVVDEVVQKVREGADFATLALRWSEDGRRDGGLLPAFGRGFPHPVAEVAFGLERGEVSAPFQKGAGDDARWYVVYCLDRIVGRDVPFASVRDELDRELRANPLTQLETRAYALRWRGSIEAGARDAKER